MKPRSVFLVIATFVVFYLLTSSIFIVDQVSQAIVLQFGEYIKSHTEPGLKFKIPFIQEVKFYEKRIISYDSNIIAVKTADRKRLMVDAYARYYITDPLQFYKTVQPSDETGVRLRLDSMIPSSIQNVLGKIQLRDLLSPKRAIIMKQIQTEIENLSKSLGIKIVDVRIVRTELPMENRPAVFERFNQTLIRSAKGNRADGEEKARGIRAEADRECVILLAEAQKKSQGIRGKGDATAIELTTKAFQVDLEFYSFYRSLEAYKDTIKGNTHMYLSSDHPFFKYLTPKK